MSTWTSELRRAALFGAALFLAGCGGAGPWTGGGSATPAQTRVAVTTDAVVVTGPAGFCVDPQATRDRGDTAFVLLGNCAAITNSRRAGQPEQPALLTASISEPSDAGSLRESIPGLDEFFRSDQGRQLLSRNQDPASVEILDSFHQGDVFFLHARDTSEGVIDGVGDEYWRAYMDVGTRIATLSVLGLQDQPISDQGSLATLRAFVGAVDGANSGAAATPVVAPVAVPPRQQSGALWNIGLFRRIFN